MTTSASDHRPALYAGYEQAAVIVAGVRSNQLELPTPCMQFDVAALVDHIVGAGDRAVAFGRGEAATTDDFPHVDLSDAPDRLRSAGRDARKVWDDDDRLTATVVMPWGETYDGVTLVNMYAAELAAHAWDLAAATGQLDRLDPALAGPVLDAAQAMLKAEYRDLLEPGSPYGAELPAPVDASDWERFAAFMGRSPRP